MFDATLSSSPTIPRSLRERVRAAVDTALEFATLGEAQLSRPDSRPGRPTTAGEHPHRRSLDRRHKRTRPGIVPPRPQACLSPTTSQAPDRS
jgi:hypothetical protein